MMNSVRELFGNLTLGKQLLTTRNQLPIASFERFYKYQKHDIPTPKPGDGKQYRRCVSSSSSAYRLCEIALMFQFHFKFVEKFTIPMI